MKTNDISESANESMNKIQNIYIKFECLKVNRFICMDFHESREWTKKGRGRADARAREMF